jgi:signal transduction histidine kinase
LPQDGSDPRDASLNNTWPGRSSPTWTGFPVSADSELEPGPVDTTSDAVEPPLAWRGWRLQLLLLCAALGLVGLAVLAAELGSRPHVDAAWRADGRGRVELASSADPVLRPYVGKALSGVADGSITVAITSLQGLQRSPRWLVKDAERARFLALHQQLDSAFAGHEVRLHFADGAKVTLQTTPRGLTGLPIMFWLLASFGLCLALVGASVLLAKPSGRNLAYAVMAMCQGGNLVFMAIEATLELGLPTRVVQLDMPVRMAFDLVTAAALVNAVCLNPRRLPGSTGIALGGWAVAGGLLGLFWAGMLPHAWWWTQLGVVGLGLFATGLLGWSYRIEPHPFAIVLQRFSFAAIATWTLLTAAVALADQSTALAHNVADIASLVWYVFFGSVLLLAPFLIKSQDRLREFSLIAATTTVAISLDVLFSGALSFEPFTSLTLSLLLSLAMYVVARRWILNQPLGSSALTAERMFEQLYRIAREVEARPERTAALLAQLLGELFEPLEIDVIERRSRKSRVTGDGSGMLVPVPLLGGDEVASGSVMIRFAQSGRHLFSSEDARLTDRIVEQLRRAVHFDKAVEQGRREERLRLAQDLHDDIGARLLTLMYKSQSPEMEDYVRHTLQDLKTLTRGLAASNHRLSHAAAEWKTDLMHRLTAAHVALKWNFAFDDDILLTVVHWSALTRVLRELVSNAIAHAQATQLDIDFRLEGDRMELNVSDDGVGRNPRAWSHGLGLGGVRKRVKQLGGEVEWREVTPHGISCRVIIRELSARW